MPADPAPRADASHPLVAKVLAVTPRDSVLVWDDVEAVVAHMVGEAYRGLAEHVDSRHGAYASIGPGDLRALADEIDPPEATP